MPKEFGAVDPRRGPEHNDADDTAAYEAEELGLEVTDLSAERAEELGYKPNSGVLITKVDPDKVAGERGIKEGMLISKVGKQHVKNLADFKAALKHESLKDGIVLLVRDQRGTDLMLLKE
jgi:S1-C subfamily serine protease